jgi:hypothetical protein
MLVVKDAHVSIDQVVRLGVDLGTSRLRAVVAWPDGTAMVLPLAEVGWLDASVLGDADRARGGLFGAARDRVRAAVSSVGSSRRGGGRTAYESAAVVLFEQVAECVLGVVGRSADVVTFAVPAGWSSRRLAVLREVGRRAGFGVVEVVSVPVAVGWHLLAGGVRLPVGGRVMVCEVGDGCVATVLGRTGSGFEVLSSVDADTVRAGVKPAGAPADDVPRSTGRDEEQAEAPVEDVAARAVAGADVGAGALDLVCVVGAAAGGPWVAEELRRASGVEPMRVAQAELAAVLGAVQTPLVSVNRVVHVEVREAGWWDLTAVILPVVWSVALFGQFLAGGERYGPREKLFAPGMLLAAWGGLAFAATLGLIGVVGGLAVVVALRHGDDGHSNSAGTAAGWVRHRFIALALLGGAAGGVLVAAVYALVAAGLFDLDVGPLLRWSVLPVVPAAVMVMLLAVVVWWRPSPPDGSWLTWLRFPPPVTMLAGFGALLVSFDEIGSPSVLNVLAWQLHQWLPQTDDAIIGPVGRLGGLCIGAAVGVLIVRRPLHRVLLAVPLAGLVAGALAWRVTGTVAVGFSVAVAGWWAARTLWLLLRPMLFTPPALPLRQPRPSRGDRPGAGLDAAPGWSSDRDVGGGP